MSPSALATCRNFPIFWSSATVLALLLTSAACAEQAPRSAGFDPHVQSVVYNPLNVVRVMGSPTSSTQIIFATEEEITQVSLGDETAWLTQPAGNFLFLKPLGLRPPTNMQVVTRRSDRSSRSYQFRLVATSSGAVYAVSFRYPDDEEKARIALALQQAKAATEKASTAQLADAWTQGPRNWRYVAQGSSLIEPTEVSDNGRQTAFRFPGNRRVPTIYTASPDGTQTIVPYTMVGDVTLVQTSARAFILRDGQEVLRIVNQGFDPTGHNPGTGTGLPELSRTIKSSRSTEP